MDPTLVACAECDRLHRDVRPPRGGVAHCTRCGAELRRGTGASLDKALALHGTALILFILTNTFPLAEFHLHGTVQVASLPECARILAVMGWPWLSAVLIATVIVAPLVHLGGMTWVLVRVRQGRGNRLTGRVFKVVEHFEAWRMAEVFLLGVIVSYMKLSKMAVLIPGPSLFALGAFVVVAAAALSSLEPHRIWEALDRAPALPPAPEGARTAREAGLVSCLTCGRLAPLGPPLPCPRCGATLHSRKPESRTRTWALLLTSAILYVPANALPVMRVVSLGKAHSDTIVGGVIYFIQNGSWPLALLIFVASVMVPILKITVLTFLLLSEQTRSAWRPDQRARLYRLTEMVGRWSMVDVFVISLMVALVELGNVASIAPEPGSVAFALMVVTTMLAAHTFDPRLVWDSLEPEHG